MQFKTNIQMKTENLLKSYTSLLLKSLILQGLCFKAERAAQIRMEAAPV